MMVLLKNKSNAVLFALGIALFFSARILLWEFEIAGTAIVNDFTRIFLFAIDLAVLVAILFLTYLKRESFKLYLSRTGPTFWLALLVTWGVATTLFNPHFLSVALLTRLILAATLFALLINLAEEEKKSFFFGLIIGGLLQSLIAIGQVLGKGSLGLRKLGESPLVIGDPGVATITLGGEKILRAYGTLPHANILALFLGISLLLGIYYFQQEKDRAVKKRLLLILMIIGLGLLLTFSRTFLIIVLLAGIALFWANKKPSKNTSKKAAAFLVLAVILVSIVFWQRTAVPDRSLALRGLYSQVAIEQIKQNPLQGVGAGLQVLKGNEALMRVLEKQQTDYDWWMHEPVHNAFLLVWAEKGLVALSIIIAFFIILIKKVLKKLYYIEGIILGVLLIALLTEHMIWTNPNALYLAFALLAFVFLPRHKVSD